MRFLWPAVVTALALSRPAAAQDFGDVPDETSVAASVAAPPARVLGILPNYGTVERQDVAAAMSRTRMFEVTARNTFDPIIFPFTGLATVVGQRGPTPYALRYGTAFADNAIGNFLTSAVFPSMLGQDPRYYRRGGDRAGRRAWYALSRIIVTRSSTGRAQLNASELAGNLAAGAIANAYYPEAGRSATATLTRWGTQVMWDAVSNELKEFWPDVQERLRAHRHFD